MEIHFAQAMLPFSLHQKQPNRFVVHSRNVHHVSPKYECSVLVGFLLLNCVRIIIPGTMLYIENITLLLLLVIFVYFHIFTWFVTLWVTFGFNKKCVISSKYIIKINQNKWNEDVGVLLPGTCKDIAVFPFAKRVRKIAYDCVWTHLY